MKKLFILLLIVIIYFFPKQVSAQQCVNGGVTCCVDGTGPNGERVSCAYSGPGSCNSLCNPVCDGGYVSDSICYYEGQTPGGGGGGGGGYQFPTCDGGTVLNCGTPALYVSNTPYNSLAQCTQRGSCGDDYFPSISSSTWNFTISSTEPWWQVKDGDITTTFFPHFG